MKISTHTPAWGVTHPSAHQDEYRTISTHTPAWGVTDLYHSFTSTVPDFNSHARVGRDTGQLA